jgi:signal transduction histidine kinase
MASVAAGERSVEERRRDRSLWRLLAGLATLAMVVSAWAALAGPGSDQPAPDLWIVVALWAATMGAGAITVGLPASGVGGVPEHTTLLELATVLLMVFLAPGWAVLVAVTASLAFETLVHRHEARKVVFNTGSEALAVALGATSYQVLAGPGFDGSWRSLLAALVAAAVYVAVNLGTFAALVAVLSGGGWEAIRSEEMGSSLLVSSGIATTGVMAAVLVAVAPWALPLVAVPTVLDHLRARARQQGLELAASKQAAERANQAKSRFLSRMSHELRTPLNAMLGYGQLLEADRGLDDDAREQVGIIVRSGWHLRQIVDEVLDLSQIEAGKMNLELQPVRVADVAAESIDLVVPLARDRDVRVDLVTDDAEVFGVADHQRLRQVLINLLSNAVKYNDVGGRVTVTIEPSDAGVRVEVVDTGPGIAPEHLDRLFEPFERLSRDRSDVEGTGLGLSVSRGFVEAMGGELTVTSTLGEGSSFAVLLPAAPA